MMEFIIIIALLLFNFAISAINAVSVGMAWGEAHIVGGWQKIVTYSAAIMSAAGFTWCYLIIVALAALQFSWLDEQTVQAMLSLGYLVIIFPILGSGIAIMINSWAYAWKNRNFSSIAIASYNTFAQGYNSFRAISMIPEAIKSVVEGLSKSRSSDSKGTMGILLVILVVVVLIAGTLTTIAIIKWVGKKDQKKSFEKVKSAYS